MSVRLHERIQYDTRLVKRNLERGKLDRDEWNQELKKLPDVSEKSEAVFPDSGAESQPKASGKR